MRRAQQSAVRGADEAYERHVRELVLRLRDLRFMVGFYRYVTENGRLSRRRELTFSVSWTGRSGAPALGFPVEGRPPGGSRHA